MKQFNFDFIKNKKIFFGISLGIMFIGIIFNFIFGTQLDIQFTGGAIIKYSYTGDLDESQMEKLIQDKTTEVVEIQLNKNVVSAADNTIKNNVSVEFGGNDALSVEQQTELSNALEETFPENHFEQIESSSVNPSMGHTFFWKCMTAIAIASILMVLYVAFRFKKISGLSAGVMALVALIHDVIMVYFTFVIFRLPLDDNFIAVVLMILGYSLNDTIVIYDRIRENRKKLGPKTKVADLVNASINQTLSRTINTSISTVMAIGTVLVVALFFKLDSVVSFALPMMIGVISGCYSTISIAGPLWVMWQEHKEKKLNQEAVEASE